jgi:hypothetical protein
MFLTLDYIIKKGACNEGQMWFKRNFPEGAELIDVINSRTVSDAFLDWGMRSLKPSPEEWAAYYKKIEVDCGEFNETIQNSKRVKNSENVVNGKDVSDSKNIYDSTDISNSEFILQAEFVDNSKRVYSSSYVYDSENVYQSLNVTNGSNIRTSSYILDSSDVFNSTEVSSSHYITADNDGDTKNIDDCWFIKKGTNLSHCLFCCNLSDKEYHIFNKPVDKKHYDVIIRQLSSLVKDYKLWLTRDWKVEEIPLSKPTMIKENNYIHRNFPKHLLKWLKTIPGYDAAIVYYILLKKEVLLDTQ